MDCLSLYFWQTNSYWMFLYSCTLSLSWAVSLLSKSSLLKLRLLPAWDLFFSPAAPFLEFTGTHGLRDWYWFAGLVGAAQCVQQSPGWAVKDAHTGVGTQCNSKSGTSLGKQTTRLGTAWNKIHLSIAVVLQRNYNSKDQAIIQQLPQHGSCQGWLSFVPGSLSQAP